MLRPKRRSAAVDVAFHAGPWAYQVKVSDEALHDGRGKLLNGKLLPCERAIVLAPDLRPEQREETLRHEIAHAFEMHFPAPRTAEEIADLVATISRSIEQDLERIGGWAAVHQLFGDNRKRGAA